MERRNLREIKKICVIFFIVNLPFLTVAHLFGFGVFIDSYYHPDAYQCLRTFEEANKTFPNEYFIIETTDHQTSLIQNGDTILYRSGEGVVRCEQVLSVTLLQGTTIYYTLTSIHGDITGPIYESQVLGKVTGTIDDTLWNGLCLQLWDFSKKNLNALTLFDMQ